jgi:hypothetical protein
MHCYIKKICVTENPRPIYHYQLRLSGANETLLNSHWDLSFLKERMRIFNRSLKLRKVK